MAPKHKRGHHVADCCYTQNRLGDCGCAGLLWLRLTYTEQFSSHGFEIALRKAIYKPERVFSIEALEFLSALHFKPEKLLLLSVNALEIPFRVIAADHP